MTEKNIEKRMKKEKEKEDRIKGIWGPILPALIDEIQKAENNSYSINLLEEVKMANKDVRKQNEGNKEKSSLDINVNENANSRILAKLFQYKSPNGEYEILQSLLNYICNERDISDFGIDINDKPIITTEEALGQQDSGRIDILVRIGSNAIIFENKLFNAPDQEHQLAKYIEKVKSVKKPNTDSKYNDENIFVIYLSRKGDEPAPDSWIDSNTKSSYSESFADRYANISFREDIRLWLKDYVLPNVRKKDTDLESALVQYINYLDRMFMKNNDDLTNWLEEKLEEGESNEPDHMVKIHCLEKVEGLIDFLNSEIKKEKFNKTSIITVQKLEKLREFIIEHINKKIGDLEKINDLLNKTDTQEGTDLLNKVIDVIENLRDDCRKEVLKPFYHVSKDYFDEILPSRLSAAYCRLFKKKWEGEIRFFWFPFFFNDNKKDKYEYKLALEIILTKDAETNKNRIRKFNTVQNAFVQDAIKEIKVQESNIEISYKYEPQNNNNNSTDVSEEKEQASPRVHKLLEITLETNEKLLYFDPKHQETLFRAIYESLSEIINAIDAKYPQNPA